jgi:protein-tyrosine kinase
MSLVEKALQMLQRSSAGQPPSSPRTLDGVAHAYQGAAARRVADVPQGPAVSFSLAAFRAAGLLAPADEERRFAQEYRQIKRPLIDNAIGRGTGRLVNGHVIMMASAMPGEGKTFTAINLALSMSIEKDLRVLLVDADVAKPQISRLLGADKAPGLLDVLRDTHLDVENVIMPTDVRNLSVLPAGTQSLEATELLASARMEQVMSAIARRDARRVAIVDSPPLMLTTESRAIARVAGQVVVVVRAAATPQHTVLAALRYLGEHRAVSLVFNHDEATEPAGYYDYGAYSERGPEPSSGQ